MLKTDERRQSRIKETKELIRTKGLSGLLNNTKWVELLEWVDASQIAFDVKLLSEDKPRHCDFIREIENSSVLIDDTGDFIELLEIELLKFKKEDRLTNHLENLKIQYLDKMDDLIVQGYSVSSNWPQQKL